MAFKIEETGIFRGAVTFLNAILNTGSVADSQVAASAGIAASKLEHDHRASYVQESDTTAAAETRVVHVVHGTTGQIMAVKAGCVTPCVGDATITVDLLVNGSSVLTTTFNCTSSQSAYDLVAGAINTDTLATGDVIEIAITVAAGTGTLAKGVFAYVDIHEDAE